MADQKDIDAVLDSVTFGWGALFPKLRAIFSAIADLGASETFATLNFTPDDDVFAHVADSTADYAADRAAELVGMKWIDGELKPNPNPAWAITDSTRNMLRSTINQALDEGWSAGRLRDAIMQNYGFSARRALNIARTERNFAQVRGGLIAAKASGVVKYKRSTLASAHPEPDECDDAADVGWIPLDEEFPMGEDSPPAQGPPYHPSCSCILRYSTQDEPEAES